MNADKLSHPVTSNVNSSHRLVFANQLRGLAALFVVATHLVAVFWLSRDIVSMYTATPVTIGPSSAMVGWIACPWFNPGPFGVALFFLISGLVIPISLEQHSGVGFVIARIMRVFPTFMVCFAICILSIWVSARVWDLPFPPIFNVSAILANFLLIQDFFQYPDLSLVSWSLLVELKFYIIMLIFAKNIIRGNIYVLLFISIFLVTLNILVSSSFVPAEVINIINFGNIVKTQGIYICFMIIGVIFNFRLRKTISSLQFCGGLTVLVFLFVLGWRTSAYALSFPIITVNYIYALIVFSSMFYFRRHIRSSRALDALASISFPLYIIHSIIGFSTIKLLMMKMNIPYYLSLCITLGVLFVMATAVHLTVECWSIAAGKKWRVPKHIPSNLVHSVDES